MYKDLIIQQLPDFYKNDQFINDFFNAVGITLDSLLADMTEVDQQRFFDKLTILLRDNEKLLALTPKNTQTIDDRRSNIQAKWQSNSKSDIYLLQNIANSWKNGEVTIDFVQGKIKLTFVGAYGIPKDLESLENAINKIKPAHLAFYMDFKWLLKKNIHNVMTKSYIQTLKKSNFARGVE